MRGITVLAASVALCAGALAHPSTAKAEFISGNKLYRYCTGTESAFSQTVQSAMCLAYIQGAHDGLEASGTFLTIKFELDNPMKVVCVPDGVETSQLQEIVTKYLRENPADRNLSASLLVLFALRTSYPCSVD